MNVRPIDANALIECTTNYRCGLHGVRRESVEKIFEYIDDAPTIDCAPVKHGRWGKAEIDGYDGLHTTYAVPCSVCGNYTRLYLPRYCPNCGAKMDGKEK